MTAMINYHRRGSGTPLVLIHGIGSRWQMWLPVMDRLGIERPHVSGNSMGGQTRFVRIQLKVARGGTKLLRPVARQITATSLGRIAVLSGVVAHPSRVDPEEAALMIEGGADAAWFEVMLYWHGEARLET
jgi:hypothetical protein